MRTKAWTRYDVMEENICHIQKQEKQQALSLYDETGSIAKVINKLGYPTRQNMYTWIKNRNIEKKKKVSVDYSDTPAHRRHPSLDLKLSIIHRCFEEEDIKSVSEETGYSRTSIYLWRKKYVVGGAVALTSEKNTYLEVKSLQIRPIMI